MSRSAETVRPTVDALQSTEAMRRQWHLRPDDGEPGGGADSPKDVDDPSEQACAVGSSMPTQVPQSTPHGGEPAGKEGGSDYQTGHPIGRTKCDMNTKRYAVANTESRPTRFFISAAEVSDYIGRAARLGCVPKAKRLLGDHRYDAD